MNLISILLGLAAERFFGQVTEFRRFDWLILYSNWLRRMLPSAYCEGPLMVGLLLLLPIVVVLIFMSILGYFSLILSIIILIYCLGPKRLEPEVETIIDASEKDDEILLKQIAADLAEGKTYISSESDTNDRIINSLFVEANDRYFSVIFWFALIGPVGALIYRCSSQFSQYLIKSHDPSDNLLDTVVYFHKLLDWLPAQLVALSYTITGSFIHGFDQWRLTPKFAAAESVNAAVLINTGRGAVLSHVAEKDLTTQTQAVMALIWRTLWVWMVAIAIFTLAGWVQ